MPIFCRAEDSSPPARLDARRSVVSAGFTLMEVLAAIFLTSLVLGVAINFYLDLSHATQRASDFTRDIRRATALLDRIGHEIEGAMLVQKPEDKDPLTHPWIFVAENHGAESGSDRLKFITQNHTPQRSDTRESNIAVVSYLVRTESRGDGSGNEDLELHRWSSPGLPADLDRDFPTNEETQLMADGLTSFSMEFLAEEGGWVSEWDSSQLARSSQLPVAVKLQLALESGEIDEFDEPRVYEKTVYLPVRPIDLALLLDPSQYGVPEGGIDALLGGLGDGELDPRIAEIQALAAEYGYTPEQIADFLATLPPGITVQDLSRPLREVFPEPPEDAPHYYLWLKNADEPAIKTIRNLGDPWGGIVR